jgi:hypothetical protein
MATRTNDPTGEALAESLMPGWKAVKSGTGQRPESGYKDNLAKAGLNVVTMPSLAKLKAKYAGIAGADAVPAADLAGVEENPDTAIVNLQNGPLTKTVAVSKSARKVLWSQG